MRGLGQVEQLQLVPFSSPSYSVAGRYEETIQQAINPISGPERLVSETDYRTFTRMCLRSQLSFPE